MALHTFAAMSSSEVDVRVLLAVAIIIVATRLAGWLIARVGQPRVHGEILAGICLGPSLLGLAWPKATEYVFPPEALGALRILAQLGLVTFMFLVGLELDLALLRGQGHKPAIISTTSIVLPMALGVLLGLWLHPRLAEDVDRTGFALFIGAAMAITAFPVLVRVLQETGLHNTRIGVLTVTCAAFDDVTAWCVLAGVVAIVKSTGPADTLRTVGLSLAFVVVMLALIRPALRRLPSIPVWLAVTLALVGAWTTEEIGIHAIFGGFMAGAVMPRRPEIRSEVHDQLETATLTLLLPVFFVIVGLSTRIDALDSAYLWMMTGLVVVTAIAGKWGGSMAAARVTGESWRDAAAIGILLNTRGLTELVILRVGLELEVITTELFTIMVLMALVTTLMATPLLALVSPIYHRHQVSDPWSTASTAAAAMSGWVNSADSTSAGSTRKPRTLTTRSSDPRLWR